jgi:hypothetical protein
MNSSPRQLLNTVRQGCRFVSAHAEHVRIRAGRLPDFARSLSLKTLSSPQIDWGHHFRGSEDDTAAFFIILDTINFGSGFFPHLKKLPGLSGYFTIASHLTEHFKNHGPMACNTIKEIMPRDCFRIFRQEPDNPHIEALMRLFAEALNDLGTFVETRFNGRFSGIIESADGSAEKLVGILSEMAFFRDVQPYKGQDISFFKRAQLMAADLHCCFEGRGLGRFEDLDRLTIFADNLVPHVLRLDGILEYSKDLIKRIDQEVMIPKDSPEEIEIRASALHAVEQMVQILKADGTHVTAMGIDSLLWNRGQSPHYKKTKPRHRTRTVFY